MSTHTLNKKSWESLSSTFSNLEISVSQDSCYASDELSISPTNPITAGTSLASFTPARQDSLHSLLKPILKRPYSDIEEDEEPESGYGTDDSDYDYASVSDEHDDEMYAVSTWDEASDVSDAVSENCDDDGESVDGSFISFESVVRFDTNVRYIEAPEPQEEEAETPRTELTCHELMEMARASGTLRLQGEQVAESDSSDKMPEHDELSDSIKQWPEEHPSDIVDLDKRLFIAYINGINGIADPGYKARLRERIDDIRKGHAQSPYLESDNAQGVYLDNVLNHVLGTFRNIIVQEELDELATLTERTEARQQTEATEGLDNKLLDKIEHLLSERLAGNDVEIGQDELSFFAGGVAYALQNWASYTSH
ncbi:hypothetical protein CNMCM8980_002071 [Aspergillus fumigatiaffinis]|jgi:plasmid stabilization system protein ParE|uniref:Uncharacterized protein n=1 Tax=Aspergillus fumigatiaffinis TaxID=340414 RepID=A0A8H4GU38_9EURO|nr:hypothetical protein CNMCM5878_002549 [Aspergillus fumigatiaffinis]KAF4220885.1 hypothetical protein CNMCM6457_002171 [Aspergillus fumigatiaffinis]KAF4228213.1 hypothetical protein CNMCM6805_002280 [Aspergillus fumigatiaffinis]KAF4238531.1 hypothetical protein CNMCM8980_002071 [Aspergillus fumigatiaffinis]